MRPVIVTFAATGADLAARLAPHIQAEIRQDRKSVV